MAQKSPTESHPLMTLSSPGMETDETGTGAKSKQELEENEDLSPLPGPHKSVKFRVPERDSSVTDTQSSDVEGRNLDITRKRRTRSRKRLKKQSSVSSRSSGSSFSPTSPEFLEAFDWYLDSSDDERGINLEPSAPNHVERLFSSLTGADIEALRSLELYNKNARQPEYDRSNLSFTETPALNTTDINENSNSNMATNSNSNMATNSNNNSNNNTPTTVDNITTNKNSDNTSTTDNINNNDSNNNNSDLTSLTLDSAETLTAGERTTGERNYDDNNNIDTTTTYNDNDDNNNDDDDADDDDEDDNDGNSNKSKSHHSHHSRHRRHRHVRSRSLSPEPSSTSSSRSASPSHFHYLTVSGDPGRMRKHSVLYAGGIEAGIHLGERKHSKLEDVIKVFKAAYAQEEDDDDDIYTLTDEVRDKLDRRPSQTSVHEERSAPVKFFSHELSCRGRLRKFFIRNATTRIASTVFDLILKVVICILYVVRVHLDDIENYECYGHRCNETTGERDKLFEENDVNWYVLLWVHRSTSLWLAEVILAFISLSKALLHVYISTKGHRLEQIKTKTFFLEVICAVPMLATVAYPPLLKNLFVPVFFNCWLARRSLEKIYNDLHLTRQRFQTISVTSLQQMILVLFSITCLIFATFCCVQHIQRGTPDKSRQLTLFDSMYFVIVTFSTVGYGDISPDIWISRLFMLGMICAAFATIPKQIEGLVSTYMERRRSGGEYSRRAASRNKHVIVCSSVLTQDMLMDFLNEFYAHPKLEDHTVILLCPQELDSSKQVILKDPKWTHRVIYMKGSILKDIDLKRCRMFQADACFFLAPRPALDKAKADRHTILRSWAVKDYAPHCKQYIQLFIVANKIHVKFAEHVVCEDEFKYALLANNCLYPGLSTLVSLLVHTSTGQEGVVAPEPWQQVYGRHSGNEIYHIQLQKSVFFSQYEGETFPRASADAHRRFGVALLGVLDSESASPRLQLNPGPQYKLKAGDFCFYMSVTREEYSKISPEALKSHPRKQNETLEQIALALQKYHLENEATAMEDGDESVFDTITSLMGKDITRKVKALNQQLSNPGAAGYKDINKNEEPRTLRAVDLEMGDQPDSRFHTFGATSVSSAKPLLKDKKGAGKDDEDAGDTTADDDYEEDGDDSMANTGTDKATSEPLGNVDHRHGAGRVLQYYNDMGQENLTTGPPPITIYSGSRKTNCHILNVARHLCCLEWGQNCSHCTYKNANDKRWHHQLIILAAEHPTSGIFNFIVPLRSSFIGVNGLSPIVLLLEEEPDSLFLDTIAQFPLVYYMIGSIRRVDDLLVAGINKASHLVVVNRDSDVDGEEEILADSETIVAVQTIFRLFPNTNVITELSQASNMRFMQFTAHDSYSQKAAKLEQEQSHKTRARLKSTLTSNLNHIFRLPFAGGQVFSASMLDTLLYQTFVKGYLISFVRLLLGIDAEEGSGHLSSIRVKRATVQKFPEYGELYEGLCSATGEIPFAIYRTERVSTDKPLNGETVVEIEEKPRVQRPKAKSEPEVKSQSSFMRHRFSVICRPDPADLGGLIRNRLKSLDLAQSDYSEVRKRPNTRSYIITNPSPKRKLRIGDIVYVIQPWAMFANPSKHKYYAKRSHSYSGPSLSPKNSTGNANNSLSPNGGPRGSQDSTNGEGKRIGRFQLKKHLSDNPDLWTGRPRSKTVAEVESREEENKL